jgi:hypothetical protein
MGPFKDLYRPDVKRTQMGPIESLLGVAVGPEAYGQNLHANLRGWTRFRPGDEFWPPGVGLKGSLDGNFCSRAKCEQS